MSIEKRKNKNGQALLFVVVAVTIALSVGISVATRTLSSQKRVASSDTAARVSNAAEGGAEWALGQTYTVLSALSSGTTITYPSAPGDRIVTKATITAGSFSTNASDHYWFDLSPGTVKEINLVGYGNFPPVVCWENSKAAIYALSYKATGNEAKGYYVSTTFDNSANTSGFSVVDNSAHPEHPEYTACASVSIVSNAYGLRLRTLYDSTRVHVYPVGGVFPAQGYKIKSVGELVSGGASDYKESRIVVVYKSFPYAASIIDAGLYSASGGIN